MRLGISPRLFIRQQLDQHFGASVFRGNAVSINMSAFAMEKLTNGLIVACNRTLGSSIMSTAQWAMTRRTLPVRSKLSRWFIIRMISEMVTATRSADFDVLTSSVPGSAD